MPKTPAAPTRGPADLAKPLKETHMWYHGTRRGFTRGGFLFPRSMHGGTATNAPTTEGKHSPASAEDWVYITGDLDLAWAYAFHAAGRGRPKVLVVEPVGPIEHDPEHSHRMDAWRCEWAKVTRVLTEPTITEQEARDGWVGVTA